MGFPTGFLAGVALTTSTLYIFAQVHAQNRARQSALLSSQNTLLTNVFQPTAPEAPAVARPVQAGIIAQAKDRWNREVEGFAKGLFDTDWSKVRSEWEERAGNVVSKLVDSSKRVGKMWKRKSKM